MEVLCEESRRQEKDERAQSQRTRGARRVVSLPQPDVGSSVGRDVEVIGDGFET